MSGFLCYLFPVYRRCVVKKIQDYFKTVNFLGIGLLIALFGSYLAAETIISDEIDFDENEEIEIETQPITQPTTQDQELADKIAAYLDRLEDAGFSGTVLVAQNGEILLEEGYGLADKKNKIANTSATVFDTGSLSKQFTAAAIMHLEEQGKLKVDDTLTKFFDDVPADKVNITIHQLLTHSSGLPSYVYEDDFAEISREEAIKLAFDAKLKSQPGEKYLYSDTGYGLLAAIIEITSEQPFPSYLKQYLFEPAVMKHTGFYNDPQWQEMTVAHGYNNGKDFGSAATRPGPYWGILGFGGVLTTVGDLYSWNTALEDNLVLSKKSISKLFTPYIKEEEDGDSYYGYGWAIEEQPEYGKMISHDGATDSQNSILIKYSDSHNTLIVILANRIDRGWFKQETFYGTDTGFVLGSNILKQDFSELPEYAR